jgi:predicted ATPase
LYIDQIKIRDFRTFSKAEIDFVHPNADFAKLGLPKPRLPNVNLILGNNGLGKTTLLKAVSLAALGPAVRSSGIYAYRLVRRGPEHQGKRAKKGRGKKVTGGAARAAIEAFFTPHSQDLVGTNFKIESKFEVTRRGDLEEFRWTHTQEKRWHPIFSEESEALFFVGYGATRRVEKPEQANLSGRRAAAFVRARRVQSLFEEAYSLIPLNAWLPQQNKGRAAQVIRLINDALGQRHFRFSGEMENGEYVFDREGLRVPFPAMSDGYRAFLGWLGDLLYHVCMTCPSGKKLTENHGIVMVDEVDLHLHPQWQMSVLPTLAEALPNIQFIVTSHSPLIVGSLEWMNIIVMQPTANQAAEPARIRQAVHGLDSDQVLITKFFGLESTRAESKQRKLKQLTLRARDGDSAAAKSLLEAMSRGAEET